MNGAGTPVLVNRLGFREEPCEPFVFALSQLYLGKIEAM